MNQGMDADAPAAMEMLKLLPVPIPAPLPGIVTPSGALSVTGTSQLVWHTLG
jgi:hypothetical protein